MSEQVDLEVLREVLEVLEWSPKEAKATTDSFSQWQITRRYVMDNNLDWLRKLADEIKALRAIVSDVDMELISETPLSDTHWEQIKLRIDEYATGGNDDDTR